MGGGGGGEEEESNLEGIFHFSDDVHGWIVYFSRNLYYKRKEAAHKISKTRGGGVTELLR